MNTPDLIKILKNFLEENPGPIYLSIPNALIEAINTGVIREGDRLPPQRFLAKELGTDLTTITRGISEARKRGLVDATVGRGTFIRIGAAETRHDNVPHAVVDMTMNIPPIPETPSLKTLIHSDIGSTLRQQDLHALLSYRMTGGTPDERRLGGDWILPTVGPKKESEILVVPGAQAAIASIVTAFLSPGDVIITDRFTYPGIRTIAAQFRLVLKGVDGDGQGMLPAELDDACSHLKPRMIYCIPTIQNPTTATMSVERRMEILSIAKKHGSYILEDDAYGLLLKSPIPAMAQLDPSRVFYVSSLSKVISPVLRLAFMALPDQEVASRVSNAVRAVTLTNSGLTSALVARWIEKGTAAQIRNAIQNELTIRQKIAKDILGDQQCAHPQGPHIWLKLPDWWSSMDFVSYARRQGLGLVPSNVFTVEGEAPQRVRIALGSSTSRENLTNSLESVAKFLKHKRTVEFAGIV
ncbi:PLP-dependent aminotransferase family protein [Acetobacter senegalensis]|uniref:aminotransferase-like domain-containing protein n=1 Tax=Acetobacter senegalensis TaxID=446692 RepID=UPI00209F978B|nr:PLP-dependent aminotransferase family protein [Acetobacter senegalensis]MCP1197179.1 PLP-dependent aminotransferase family protein [Acetobacter senegalensis]